MQWTPRHMPKGAASTARRGAETTCQEQPQVTARPHSHKTGGVPRLLLRRRQMSLEGEDVPDRQNFN